MSAAESKGLEAKELVVIKAQGNNFLAMQENAVALKKRFEEQKALSEIKQKESEAKEITNFNKSVELYKEATEAFHQYLINSSTFYQQINEMQSTKMDIPRELLLTYNAQKYNYDETIKLPAFYKKLGNLFKKQGNNQKAIEWHVKAFNYHVHILKHLNISKDSDQISTNLGKMLEILSLYENSAQEQQRRIHNSLSKKNVSDFLVKALFSVFILALFFAGLGLGLLFTIPGPAGFIMFGIVYPSLVFLSLTFLLSAWILEHQITKQIKSGELAIDATSLTPKQVEKSNNENEMKAEARSSKSLVVSEIEMTRIFIKDDNESEEQSQLSSDTKSPTPNNSNLNE